MASGDYWPPYLPNNGQFGYNVDTGSITVIGSDYTTAVTWPYIGTTTTPTNTQLYYPWGGYDTPPPPVVRIRCPWCSQRNEAEALECRCCGGPLDE